MVSPITMSGKIAFVIYVLWTLTKNSSFLQGSVDEPAQRFQDVALLRHCQIAEIQGSMCTLDGKTSFLPGWGGVVLQELQWASTKAARPTTEQSTETHHHSHRLLQHYNKDTHCAGSSPVLYTSRSDGEFLSLFKRFSMMQTITKAGTRLFYIKTDRFILSILHFLGKNFSLPHRDICRRFLKGKLNFNVGTRFKGPQR